MAAAAGAMHAPLLLRMPSTAPLEAGRSGRVPNVRYHRYCRGRYGPNRPASRELRPRVCYGSQAELRDRNGRSTAGCPCCGIRPRYRTVPATAGHPRVSAVSRLLLHRAFSGGRFSAGASFGAALPPGAFHRSRWRDAVPPQWENKSGSATRVGTLFTKKIRFRPTLGPFPVSDQWENKSCSDVTGSEVGLGPGCSPSFAANSGYDLAGVVLAAPTCHWLRPRWLSLVASGPALRLASVRRRAPRGPDHGPRS